MRIYDISPTDRTLIDPTGRECPFDPMTDEPKVPGNATTTAPPVIGDSEAAIFDGDGWQVSADWRGHTYWLADGSQHEITELGVEPPVGALDEPPPESIKSLATRQRAEIESALSAALAAGMPYTMPDGSEEIIQTRPGDEPNLLGLAIEARDLLAQNITQPTQYIRVESNAMYQLTPQQMIDLTNATKEFKRQLLGKSWVLKDRIKAALEAEDREGLAAIEWSEPVTG